MKKKVLILQSEISSYNVDVYNILAYYYDLTIGYFTKDKSVIPTFFTKIKFPYKRFGPFIYVRDVINYSKKFDLVCILPDLHIISYCILPFLNKKTKFSNWSIGFRVSYTHPYIVTRKHNILDYIFKIILNKCDSSIFYMEKSKEFWQNTSLDLSRVFVAPNTTKVNHISIDAELKKDFLFIGTLYKGKGLESLLHSYRKFINNSPKKINLNIIGAGEMENYIKEFIIENNLSEYIQMKGAIYNEQTIADEFKKALLCISPNQAGLSVAKSLGYGVAFVTKIDAITGGEIYHIRDGFSGVLYHDDNELFDILIDAARNPEKYINMGKNAKEYYDCSATVEHMAKGAINAFDYALSV